ncbi:MAG: GerMN domain-containing protein [Thermotaleaceae bacterium]
MKYRRIIALILVFSMMISLAGCKSPISLVKGLFDKGDKAASNIVTSSEVQEEDIPLRDTVLYYKDDKGFLIPVMRKIPWTEGIAKATLAALVDTPANRKDIEGIGLIPVIPANTEIRGMNITNGLCRVDFTSDFLNYVSKEEEEALVKAVVYTLTEFITIDSVQIVIEGQLHKNLKFGVKTDKPITRDNINYVSTNPGNQKVIVYYEGTINGMETYYVPVTKTIEKADNTPVTVLDALDALVEGPPSGLGLYSQIPKGTQVLGVDVSNGVAYVNFNQEIKDLEKNQEVGQEVAKAIALTVKEQYRDLTGVKILANGKEVDLGIGIEDEPVAVPTFANQY